MQSESVPVSKVALWTGRVLSFLAAAFLVMDAVMKLVKPSFVVEKTVELGFSESVIVPLGVVLLASTIIYLIPQTTVLGAILLTGYLGGAVATHVHAGDSAFEIVFPAVFGAILWGGLVLRDRRLRAAVLWPAYRPHPSYPTLENHAGDVEVASVRSTN